MNPPSVSSVLDWLAEAHSITLDLVDGKHPGIRVSAPLDALTVEVVALLDRHRVKIIRLLMARRACGGAV